MSLVIENVRLSFFAGFEPKSVNGGEPRFSASFLFPVAHPAKQHIEAEIERAAADKWGAKAPTLLQALRATPDKLCLRNGQLKYLTDANLYEAYQHQWYVSASNKNRPAVIDLDRSPLTAADGRPYSGCYVNALIELWAQDNQFGKRMNAKLLGVQWLRDGEAFVGGQPAKPEDFPDLSHLKTAPAQPSARPPFMGKPPAGLSPELAAILA